MLSVRGMLKSVFGSKLCEDDLVALWSLRLDETGTDGRSPFVLVGGAVANISQWDQVEAEWEALLKRSKLEAFHWKEFRDPRSDFGKWSRLKYKRFEASIEKIISRCTTFRISAAIDGKVHKAVKKRMQGIKGFRDDSDYSLCLRYLMFHTCEHLSKIDSDCKLQVVVECGPYSSGAEETFHKVSNMTGKWKPAKHAHRLDGFHSLPKGRLRALELADYVAGSELECIVQNKTPPRNGEALRGVLDKQNLEFWYEGMMKEREIRSNFGSKPSTN